VADAITATLKSVVPDADAYLDTRSQEWSVTMEPYLDEVASIRSAHAGAPYAATESVFDDMALALGLVDVTPPGYRNAAANESEPGPRDLHDFLEVLRDRRAAVLVYNVQTEGSGPQQIRAEAESAGVPVVEVTETPPAAQPSFVTWQLDQLRALRGALSGAGA
jgi:zinc/manganese transport system substrate-binding protein